MSGESGGTKSDRDVVKMIGCGRGVDWDGSGGDDWGGQARSFVAFGWCGGVVGKVSPICVGSGGLGEGGSSLSDGGEADRRGAGGGPHVRKFARSLRTLLRSGRAGRDGVQAFDFHCICRRLVVYTLWRRRDIVGFADLGRMLVGWHVKQQRWTEGRRGSVGIRVVISEMMM